MQFCLNENTWFYAWPAFLLQQHLCDYRTKWCKNESTDQTPKRMTRLRNTARAVQRRRREAKRLPAGWHSPECGLHLHSAHLHSLCWLITLHHPLSANANHHLSTWTTAHTYTHTHGARRCVWMTWPLLRDSAFTILLMLEGMGDCVHHK